MSEISHHCGLAKNLAVLDYLTICALYCDVPDRWGSLILGPSQSVTEWAAITTRKVYT